MNKKDIRAIQIKLDDNIIKDVDVLGVEKLRLGLNCAGKTIYIRFPTYGNWDAFVTDTAQLLLILGQTTQNLNIPELDHIDEKEFYNWAKLTSIVLRYKACRSLVEKIFFDYLRPEIEGLQFPKFPVREDEYITDDDWREQCENSYRIEWLRKHLNTAHVFQMFTSILYIEDWFKKKAILHLTATFPELTPQYSRDTLPKNITVPLQSFSPGQSYDFA